MEAPVSAFGMHAWASGSGMDCPSLLAFIAAKRTMRASLASTSLVATVFRIVNGRSWCGHGTVAAAVNTMIVVSTVAVKQGSPDQGTRSIMTLHKAKAKTIEWSKVSPTAS